MNCAYCGEETQSFLYVEGKKTYLCGLGCGKKRIVLRAKPGSSTDNEVVR